jgi:hypothetical protein
MAAIDAPWLIVSGSLDGAATPDKVGKTFERIVDRPLYRVQVDGMNHYQLTDYVDPAADRLDADGKPTLGSKPARAAVAAYAVAFLRRTVLGDTSVPDDLIYYLRKWSHRAQVLGSSGDRRCGVGDELLDVCPASRRKGSREQLAALSQEIAVGLRYFADDAVGTQES